MRGYAAPGEKNTSLATLLNTSLFRHAQTLSWMSLGSHLEGGSIVGWRVALQGWQQPQPQDMGEKPPEEEKPAELYPIMGTSLMNENCPNRDRIRSEILATVREKGMLPYYEKYLCSDSHIRTMEGHEALMAELKKQNEEEEAKLDERIKDAKENLGDIEIRDALLAKADFFNRIGDKEQAIKGYEESSTAGQAAGCHGKVCP
eukprot:Skav204605  [mRNA]  locus=scaffold1712:39093:45622:+ [translate_table: standard]